MNGPTTVSPTFLPRGQVETHLLRMLANFIQNLRGRNDLQRINSTPVLITTDSAQKSALENGWKSRLL